MPELTWRLVKWLLPIKEFLFYFYPNCAPMNQTQSMGQDIPDLSEFLSFASSNRRVLDEDDWLDP